MLNSNFDLRTFLAESKAPTEQVNEATLTEATVMEYIREKMDHMNNEVRSCMREYLNAVNEIDPGHEDAHAQLMNALEDFYNKLKAHFEEDEAHMEEPLDTNTDVPAIALEEGEEEDESFGGEEDELEEGAYGAPSGDAELDKERLEALKAELKALEDKGAPAGIIAIKKKEIASFDSVDETVVNEDAGIYQGLVDTAMSMGSDKDTALFLAGLVKTAVHVGAIPALLAALYQFKDKPMIAKAIAKLEKFNDAE